MDLTDEQWTVIASRLPPRKLKRPDRPGRPPKEPRAVWNGILWVLRTEAQWNEMLESTHRTRRAIAGSSAGARTAPSAPCFERSRQTSRKGGFDLNEGFVEGLLQRGEKGGPCVGETKRGKGTKIMAATDGAGLPLAISVASASPHEVKLIEETLDQSLIDELPDRLTLPCVI
jgi:transposase